LKIAEAGGVEFVTVGELLGLAGDGGVNGGEGGVGVGVGVGGRGGGGVVGTVSGVIVECSGARIVVGEGSVVRVVVGMGVEWLEVTSGEEEDAAAEARTVGGTAGFLVGAEEEGLEDDKEFKEGVWGGFVGGVGVEEVGRGWAGGLVDGGDDGVVVVGKEFTVVGAEVMVAVAAEGGGPEFKGGEPLEGGGGGRVVEVESGGEDGGVGEGAGGRSVREDVCGMSGGGVGEVVGGVAVRAEEEGGGMEVSGGDEGEVGGGVGGLVVEEELAGVGADVGGKGGVEGEGVEGAAREGAPVAVMGWNCTGRGGEGWSPRVGRGRGGRQRGQRS
jgi:hypothetical protein